MTGQTQTEKNTNTDSLRKSHGILVMLGWGILMLIGVMVARYMRQWDPIWFYSHTAIQSLGFVLGVAGIICGFVLSNRVSTDVDEHKTIGIIVLVLGCLQVCPFHLLITWKQSWLYSIIMAIFFFYFLVIFSFCLNEWMKILGDGIFGSTK